MFTYVNIIKAIHFIPLNKKIARLFSSFHCLRNPAHRHPLGIHGNDLVINGRNVFFAFWQYLRLKRALPVLRNIHLKLTVLATNTLLPCPIPVIRLTRAFITSIAHMRIHLRIQHFFQCAGKKVFEGILDVICRFNIILLQQSLDDVSFPFCHQFRFINFFFLFVII